MMPGYSPRRYTKSRCRLFVMMTAGLLLVSTEYSAGSNHVSVREDRTIDNPLRPVNLVPFPPDLSGIIDIDIDSNQLRFERKNLKPSRMMTVSLPMLDIFEREATVIPLITVSGRVKNMPYTETNLTIQLYPSAPDPSLVGFTTWIQRNVSCADVKPPCALPPDEAGLIQSAVVSPLGRELVILGLWQDNGTEAVYVWRDGELFHADMSFYPGLSLSSASVVAVRPTSRSGQDSKGVEFSLFGLTGNITGLQSMWQVDFSNGATSAVGSEVVIAENSELPNRQYASLYYDELNEQLIWFAGQEVVSNLPLILPSTAECEVMLFSLTERLWRSGGRFPRDCGNWTVAGTLSVFDRSDSTLAVVIQESQHTMTSVISYSVYTRPFAGSSSSSAEWTYRNVHGTELAVTTSHLVAGTGVVQLVTDVSPYLFVLNLNTSRGLSEGIFHPVIHNAAQFYPALAIVFARTKIMFQPPFITATTQGSTQSSVLLGGSVWDSTLDPYSLSTVTEIPFYGAGNGLPVFDGETPGVRLPYRRYFMSKSPTDSEGGLLGGRFSLTLPDADTSCMTVVHGGMKFRSILDTLEPPLEGLSTLWCFNACDRTWRKGWYLGKDVPAGRFNHAGFAVNASSFVIFGGVAPGASLFEFHNLKDVWLFSFSGSVGQCQGSWQQLNASTGHSMSPLSSPSVTTVQGRHLVFGGTHSAVLVVFDLSNAFFTMSVNPAAATYTLNEVNTPTNQVSGRIGHVLFQYSANSLLLFGGHNSSGGSQEAQLIDFRIDSRGQFLIEQIGDFFVHVSSSGINIVPVKNGYILMAAQSESWEFGQQISRPPIVFLESGLCRSGFLRNKQTDVCTPCPQGTWGNDGRTCNLCPNATTTLKRSSTSLYDCSPCVDDFCHHHGTCRLFDGRPSCFCDFGYDPSDNCRAPYIIVATVLAVHVSMLVIVLSLYLFRKRQTRAKELSRELRASTKRISDLMAAWRIEWSQIQPRHVVGRGGFGEVWLAELNDTLIVIKKLHSHFLQDEASIKEFQREVELMKTHRHPNIVLFLGVGTDPKDEPFLAMEYVKRGSLKSILADSSVAVSHMDRLRFMLDAAKGMAYLHGSSPSIIHRDLKCANLLVSERWVVKVADFGTARLLSYLDKARKESVREDSTTKEMPTYSAGSPLLANCDDVTFQIGTLPYQSPEMIQCQVYGTDTDVYRYCWPSLLHSIVGVLTCISATVPAFLRPCGLNAALPGRFE